MITIGLKLAAGKIRRLARAALDVEQTSGRVGDCDRCGLCCKILFRCPFYDEQQGCTVYDDRPTSCRIFPASPADLGDVERCSYSFASSPSSASAGVAP